MMPGDLARRDSRWPPSPAWSAATRVWVLTLAVVLVGALWWHVREFTPIVVSAVLLVYILNPIIVWTQRRSGLPRAPAALLVYVVLTALVVLVPLLLAPGLVRGLAALDPEAVWEQVVADVFDQLPRRVDLFARSIDLEPFYEQLRGQLGALEGAVLGRASLVWLLGFASDFAFTVLGVFFTFVTSIYLAMDTEHILTWLERQVPPGHKDAYHALRREIGAVWQSFFRGQLVLVGVIAVATTLGLVVLGVPYALPIGLLAGALEVVPRVGPTLSVVPAVAVALVRPSMTVPDLPTTWFVLLVVGLFVLIQQIENNILVPRVIGSSVNLPPAVILVGALVGAKLAGIPGILLAPPVIGSLRLLGSWTYTQLTAPSEPPPPETPGSGTAPAADPGGAASATLADAPHP